MPAEKTNVASKIVPLQLLPRRRLLALLLVPLDKLHQRLSVVSLGVNRDSTIRGQMLQKSNDPLILDLRQRFASLWFGTPYVGFAHCLAVCKQRSHFTLNP